MQTPRLYSLSVPGGTHGGKDRGPTLLLAPLNSGYSFQASLAELSDQWHQSGPWWLGGTLCSLTSSFLRHHWLPGAGCGMWGGTEGGTQPTVDEWFQHSAPAATCQESGRNRQVSSHQGQLAQGVGPENCPVLRWAGRQGKQEPCSSHVPTSYSSFFSSIRDGIRRTGLQWAREGATHCLEGSGWRAIQTVSLQLGDYICHSTLESQPKLRGWGGVCG